MKKTVAYYWLMLFTLAFTIGLCAVHGVMQSTARVYLKFQLLSDSELFLLRTINEYLDDNVKTLVAYPPPLTSNHLSDWAEAINRHMLIEVATFIKKDAVITPVLIPKQYDIFLQDLNNRILNNGDLRIDTIGSFEYKHGAPGKKYTIAMFREIGNNVTWGILYHPNEAWAHVLSEILPPRPIIEKTPIERKLAQRFAFFEPIGDETIQTGLRAYIDGKEIGRTYGLDTTHDHWSSDFDDIRLEYFLSDKDQRFIGRLGFHPVHWIVIVSACFMMVILRRFRKLCREQ